MNARDRNAFLRQGGSRHPNTAYINQLTFNQAPRLKRVTVTNSNQDYRQIKKNLDLYYMAVKI